MKDSHFKKNKKGVSIVEYGLIIATISLVCIGALGGIGNNLNGSFNTIGASMTDTTGTCGVNGCDGQ